MQIVYLINRMSPFSLQFAEATASTEAKRSAAHSINPVDRVARTQSTFREVCSLLYSTVPDTKEPRRATKCHEKLGSAAGVSVLFALSIPLRSTPLHSIPFSVLFFLFSSLFLIQARSIAYVRSNLK